MLNIEEMIKSMEASAEAIDAVAQKMKPFGKDADLCMLGTLIDTLASIHEYDPVEAVKSLAEMVEQINMSEGRYEVKDVY